MSRIRRWGLPAFLLCLSALALPCAARAADDNPPLNAKDVDALVHKTLRSVINEGADMYNGQGKYTERDYLGCYHFYEGALIAVRPLLAGRPELQKAIDDGLDNARNTPDATKRAFVLRDVIDQIREATKPGGTAVVPPQPFPTETVYTGKVVSAEKGKLTVTVGNKDKTFVVPADAKVTIDGMDGELANVKPASMVEVLTKGKEEIVAKVDAKSPTAPPPPKVATVAGKVVGVDKDKLTVSVDDKDKVFIVSGDAKVTIDGMDGKLTDLKKDSTVTVTTRNDAVVTIDAKSPSAPPPPPPPPPPMEKTTKGVVTKAEKGKLTLKDAGDKETTFTVPDDALVTIDGKEGKAEDVKEGSVVTVTTKGDAVTKINAKAPVAPPPPPPPTETKTSGKVLKVAGAKITVLPATGEAKDFTVGDDATVTIDGKEGRIEDVKADLVVTITEKAGKVTKVEGKAPVPPPPPPPPAKEKTTVGKVTKVDLDDKTVSVKDDAGKDHAFTIGADATVTINGKDGKLADLKADETASITEVDGKVVKVEVKAPAPPPPPPPAQTLWDRLGGEKGVARVVDDFVNTAGKDPKVNFYRDPTHTPSAEEEAALKQKLVEFVSSATGGPLKYTGKDMKTVHKGMKITDAEFDAAAADLKAALEKNGVKGDDETAVLAAVDGTRKDIVEVKGTDDKPKPPDDKPKPPDDKQADTGNVKGKVTYKGAPLTAAAIMLTDADGKTYTAKIEADGTYSLKDVKVGEYKVTVNANNPTNPNKVVLIPAKYSNADITPLTVTVQKGDQTHDLELD